MNNHPIKGRLRDALAAHAQKFSASPDAWQQVQAKDASLSRHRRGRSGPPGAGWLARHSAFVIPAAAAAAVVAVALGATALAHGFSGTTRPGAAAHASAKPRYSPALVSVQVKLPSRTMEAGSSMPAHIVVDNRTGHAIHVKGCGSPFQLGLESSSYHPEVAWPACLQILTIAIGKSSYPVTLPASYNGCGPVAQGSSRACLHGRPPPLPAGEYRAVLFQSPQIASAPAPIPVLVTPRSTAPPATPPGTTTPAVVSANGIKMTVSSTPRAGLLGSTTIQATVTLTGAVPAGKLDFLLGIGPADQGQPGSDELLPISGPGTYHMTTGYTPTQRGAWALSVNLWNQQGLTIISVTGMAANATSSSPYPQLVTVVS